MATDRRWRWRLWRRLFRPDFYHIDWDFLKTAKALSLAGYLKNWRLCDRRHFMKDIMTEIVFLMSCAIYVAFVRLFYSISFISCKNHDCRTPTCRTWLKSLPKKRNNFRHLIHRGEKISCNNSYLWISYWNWGQYPQHTENGG